jgi:hypothetical protein
MLTIVSPEYKYLAHITGRQEYFDAVNNVTNILQELQQSQLKGPSNIQGMLPTHYSVGTGAPTDGKRYDLWSIGAY